MNKNVIIVGIVILTFVVVGLYINNQNSNASKMAQSNIAMTQQDPQANSQQGKMMKLDDSNIVDKNASSRYIPYSKDVLNTASDKRRILYFYATWCPSCKEANEDFTTNSNKIPDDVIVIRTNYNDPDTDQEEKNLAKKYGITYQHTFVQIDSTGKEVTKWNGGQTSELLTKLK